MSYHRPLAVGTYTIELGQPVAYGSEDPLDVLRLAAGGAPPLSPDELDRALQSLASSSGLTAELGTVTGYTGPTRGRAYATTDITAPDGSRIRIARGEPRVLARQLLGSSGHGGARLPRATRTSRPLGVAVRYGDGPWSMVGHVPVRALTSQPGRGSAEYDYELVWDVWTRLSHWGWVVAIGLLTVTGYFIADPGWVPAAWVNGHQVGYFMGFVRFIHLVSGVLLIVVLLVRVWNLSTSRMEHSRWASLIPVRDRSGLRNSWQIAKAYVFVQQGDEPEYFAHNPLQQLTYTVIYVVFVMQVVTGLALWGLYDPTSRFWGLFTWVDTWLGIQQVRLVHFMLMWVILLFLPLHVYLAIRADSVDRSGTISSMISGGRWVRRGAHFEDWPPGGQP